jgi:hypothetical protein
VVVEISGLLANIDSVLLVVSVPRVDKLLLEFQISERLFVCLSALDLLELRRVLNGSL